MAWEQFIETPLLLRENDVVRFVGGWQDATQKNDRLFLVERAMQFRYITGRNVAPGQSIDLAFDEAGGSSVVGDLNLALIPSSSDTMYELLLGIKGTPFVYPMYANSFFFKLEANGVLPDTTDELLRYLGFWTEQDSPPEHKTLREHTVNRQQTPVLRVYNDLGVTQRVVLDWSVNRCKLVEVDEAGVTPLQQLNIRLVKNHRLFTF